MLNYQQFSQQIKAKYPQYQNMDDMTLAQKMVQKYPEYQKQVDVAVPQFEADTIRPQTQQEKTTSALDRGTFSLTKYLWDKLQWEDTTYKPLEMLKSAFTGGYEPAESAKRAIAWWAGIAVAPFVEWASLAWEAIGKFIETRPQEVQSKIASLFAPIAEKAQSIMPQSEVGKYGLELAGNVVWEGVISWGTKWVYQGVKQGIKQGTEALGKINIPAIPIANKAFDLAKQYPKTAWTLAGATAWGTAWYMAWWEDGAYGGAFLWATLTPLSIWAYESIPSLARKLVASNVITPGGIKQASQRLAKLTGKEMDSHDAARFMIQNNLQGSAEDRITKIDNLIGKWQEKRNSLLDSTKQFDENIAPIINDAKQILNRLYQTRNIAEDVNIQLPEVQARVQQYIDLLNKNTWTLRDFEDAKKLIDWGNLFKQTGEFAGKSNLTEQDVWKGISKFIDENAPQAGIRELWKQIEVGLTMRQAMQQKIAQEQAQSLLKWFGIAWSIGGISSYVLWDRDFIGTLKSLLVGGMFGVAGSKMQKLANNPAILSKIGMMINKLNPNEKAILLDALNQNSVIPRGIMQKLLPAPSGKKVYESGQTIWVNPILLNKSEREITESLWKQPLISKTQNIAPTETLPTKTTQDIVSTPKTPQKATSEAKKRILAPKKEKITETEIQTTKKEEGIIKTQSYESFANEHQYPTWNDTMFEAQLLWSRWLEWRRQSFRSIKSQDKRFDEMMQKRIEWENAYKNAILKWEIIDPTGKITKKWLTDNLVNRQVKELEWKILQAENYIKLIESMNTTRMKNWEFKKWYKLWIDEAKTNIVKYKLQIQKIKEEKTTETKTKQPKKIDKKEKVWDNENMNKSKSNISDKSEQKNIYDEKAFIKESANIEASSWFAYHDSLPKEPRWTRKIVKIIWNNPSANDHIIRTEKWNFQRNSQTVYKKVPIKIISQNIWWHKRYNIVDKTWDILDSYDWELSKEEVIKILKSKWADFIK